MGEVTLEYCQACAGTGIDDRDMHCEDCNASGFIEILEIEETMPANPYRLFEEGED